MVRVVGMELPAQPALRPKPIRIVRLEQQKPSKAVKSPAVSLRMPTDVPIKGDGPTVERQDLRGRTGEEAVPLHQRSPGIEQVRTLVGPHHGAADRVRQRRSVRSPNDPVADTAHVGLINTTALAHYVARDVSSLTGGKQNPDMEVRFDTTVFAVGL
jgi:hypothetical protein